MASSSSHHAQDDTSKPRETHRFITAHNSSATAVFDTSVPDTPPLLQETPFGFINLLYTTSTIPVDLTKNVDIKNYNRYVANPPHITVAGGTAVAMISMKPGAITPMHRTMSLDYDVMMEGEIEVVLDSGEVRRMKAGDSVVMRGTMHIWKNVTPNSGWARMFAVSHEIAPLEVEGQVLSEDWNGKVPQ